MSPSPTPPMLRGALVTVILLVLTAPHAMSQRPGQGGGRGGGDGAQNGSLTVLPFDVPLGLRGSAAIPADNPLTPEKVELGRMLFFDPLLSLDGSVSCASCHQPELAFADTLRVSPGVEGRLGERNSPSLLNRVFGRRFFWDGRASTLEQAVLMPVHDPVEMALPRGELLRRVSTDAAYAHLFRSAFPTAAITDTTIAKALASYVRILWSGDSPFDRFQTGDPTAMSAPAQRGQVLFFGRADCSDCHRGPNFTDEQFHALGISGSTGRFKTPTLRNVALTAPYMHDGSVRTLEEVVEFYNRGGDAPAGVRRGRGGRGIRPLGLTADERTDLVAFLRALTAISGEGLPTRSASR